MNKVMKLAPVLMEIKAHAALSPADTHAHLFWMCHLSVWPWSSDHHVRAQGQGYWQAPWRIPHLCPTIPAGRTGALLPSRVPSHPNRRGLEAGSCIPHAGSSKSCVGHSSVQGSWSGQEVAPGNETPEASLKGAALGRRPLAARPGAPCAAAARNLHSCGVRGAGGANGCSLTAGRDALGGPSQSTRSVSRRLRMHLFFSS